MSGMRLFRHIRYGVLAGLLVASLSACVPEMGHYYQPSAPDGVVSREDCNGNVGALNSIVFTRNGSKIFIYSRYDSASLVQIIVQLELTEENQVRSHWQDLNIYSSKDNALHIEVLGRYGYGDLAGETPPSISAGGFDTLDGKKHSTYEMDLDIAGSIPDEFTLVLPSMEINDSIYPSTKISFTKKFGTWFMPINC